MCTGTFSDSRRWLVIVVVVLTVTVAAQPAAATQRPAAQSMCVDCELLKEQLRIVIAKGEVFDDGLQLLRRTRRDMEAARSVAGGLAAAYTTLQGLNIALALNVKRTSATIPQSCAWEASRDRVTAARMR